MLLAENLQGQRKRDKYREKERNTKAGEKKTVENLQ